MSKIRPWRHLGTRRLATTPIFGLDAHRRASEVSGREAEFYVLDASNWVNVVAVTDGGEVVLVEQYRHGVERVTLEIPGGLVDPEDETPEHAARRELLEETGYAADRWTLLGSVDPNPAIQYNRCFTYLAEGARPVAEPTPDATEEIDVVLVDEREIPAMVLDGRIGHSLVVVAFYLRDARRRADGT